MQSEDEPPAPPAEFSTQEYVALLPDGLAEEVGLDTAASDPIYPYGLDVGLAGHYPDPASVGRDWRLLTPADSEPHRRAVESPQQEDDADYNSVVGIILESTPSPD